MIDPLTIGAALGSAAAAFFGGHKYAKAKAPGAVQALETMNGSVATIKRIEKTLVGHVEQTRADFKEVQRTITELGETVTANRVDIATLKAKVDR